MAQAKTRGRLHQYLETLGVRPGASLEDVSTAYYTLIKKFPENPTEEEEERLKKVKYAYDFLRHAYAPPKKKPLRALATRRMLVPLLACLAAVGLLVLVKMNYGAIKIRVTHYENGAVLRFSDQAAPYGEVVAFEARHQFPAGSPSPAYAIRLAGKDETVWISQRLVVTGMVPASSH